MELRFMVNNSNNSSDNSTCNGNINNHQSNQPMKIINNRKSTNQNNNNNNTKNNNQKSNHNSCDTSNHQGSLPLNSVSKRSSNNLSTEQLCSKNQPCDEVSQPNQQRTSSSSCETLQASDDVVILTNQINKVNSTEILPIESPLTKPLPPLPNKNSTTIKYSHSQTSSLITTATATISSLSSQSTTTMPSTNEVQTNKCNTNSTNNSQAYFGGLSKNRLDQHQQHNNTTVYYHHSLVPGTPSMQHKYHHNMEDYSQQMPPPVPPHQNNSNGGNGYNSLITSNTPNHCGSSLPHTHAHMTHSHPLYYQQPPPSSLSALERQHHQHHLTLSSHQQYQSGVGTTVLIQRSNNVPFNGNGHFINNCSNRDLQEDEINDAHVSGGSSPMMDNGLIPTRIPSLRRSRRPSGGGIGGCHNNSNGNLGIPINGNNSPRVQRSPMPGRSAIMKQRTRLGSHGSIGSTKNNINGNSNHTSVNSHRRDHISSGSLNSIEV